MNAQIRAPLTAFAAHREKCCYFFLDNADVVIEEMFRQLSTVSAITTEYLMLDRSQVLNGAG